MTELAQLSDAPMELQVAIQEFWPQQEWNTAAQISQLESGWNAFALADTTTPWQPCGTIIGERGGVKIAAERSVGYFQIDTCNFPDWEWQRLYNARHNAGTGHMLWVDAGGLWTPWFFSCQTLGLC